MRLRVGLGIIRGSRANEKPYRLTIYALYCAGKQSTALLVGSADHSVHMVDLISTLSSHTPLHGLPKVYHCKLISHRESHVAKIQTPYTEATSGLADRSMGVIRGAICRVTHCMANTRTSHL